MLRATLLQENTELARLQAQAALAAKAQHQAEQDERRTARWMQRLSYSPKQMAQYKKMISAASVDVDLFVSKQQNSVNIVASAQENVEETVEVVVQKQAAGEMAANQDFRIITNTDAVRWSCLPFTMPATATRLTLADSAASGFVRDFLYLRCVHLGAGGAAQEREHTHGQKRTSRKC